jgi:predicted Mrr-cat superfamily restriction endonuclease
MTTIFQMKGRPNKKNRLKLFLDEEFVCIGWPRIGDLTNADRDEIRERLQRVYEYKGQQLGVYTGAVNAFRNTMEAGDVVLVPEGVIVHVGILDHYYYDPAYDNDEDGMCHRRKVTWTATVPKSRLNPQILEFVRNRGILTKFPGSFEEAGLQDLLVVVEDGEVKKPYVLTEPPMIHKEDPLFGGETVQRARAILEEALNSDDPEKQIRAAGEILRLSK